MSQVEKSADIKTTESYIGYKKCQNNKIVKLEILGYTNAKRKGITKKDFAKMRCSRAFVLDIYDMFDENKKYDSACGLHDKNFLYKVGEIVEPLQLKSQIVEWLPKACLLPFALDAGPAHIC